MEHKAYIFWILLAFTVAVATSYLVYYDELSTQHHDNFLADIGFYMVAPVACLFITGFFLVVDIFYIRKTSLHKRHPVASRVLALITIAMTFGTTFYFFVKNNLK